MKISRFTVHRPIFTAMVTLIVIILGLVSFSRIPIDLMPDITYPTLSVRTTYENASPEEMEELVTRPIEEALSSVPGVEEVSSVSSEGNSSVRVSFSWGTDLDSASNDIRDRLDRIVSRLPDDADKPTLFKFDVASFPVLILGAYSKLDPVQMRQMIDDEVKQRIEQQPGVAALDVWGGLEREIHVDLYPDKIKALDLPIDVVLAKINEGNINLPAGWIDRGNYEITIRTPGEYGNLDELRDTVVAIRGGVPIPLREIASVEDSWQRVRRIVRVNMQPGIRLGVRKQSGTNTVEVAKAALEEVERINRDMPQIHLIPIIDTSDYIKRSITNVGRAAVYGGGLAILVLLFFLRSVRSTLIIGTAIPVSIIAAFALIYFNGFTLNIMTLGGLALGIGMLVDNSIVVLENVFRLHEGGETSESAAVSGSDEVTSAIVASTLTTLVVFLPLIFVRGMAGVMFKQLSLVVSFALFCSMVVAMTIVPMLFSQVFRNAKGTGGAKEAPVNRFFQMSASIFSRMELTYKQILHFALHHKWIVLVTLVILLASSVALVPLVGTELMPKTDEGEVRVNVEMEVGTRLGLVDKTMKDVEKIVWDNVPELKSMITSVGATGWHGGGGNTGDVRVALKPISERKRSSEDVARMLRDQLKDIPGATIRTRTGQGLRLMRVGTGGADEVEVQIRGHDLDTADALAQRVKEEVDKVEGVTDSKISRESGTPEELIVIDRAKAAQMKLTVSQVAGMLQTILSGKVASYYRTGGDEFAIRVKLREGEKKDLREILDLTLTNSDGQPVVLRNVVNVKPRLGPTIVERLDQERVVTVSANISGRDLGAVMRDVQERLDTVPKPRGFRIEFGGDYEEQQKANRELLLSFVLAVVLVYMVMACQFESLRDPFVVMFSVPMATTGVVLMLFLSGTTFNIQSFIGCIMLGGIVVNNAILLVDHTNLLRRRDGMALLDAIEEAGRRRLRPILMTAMTTVLGLTPLALGLGEGGEAQAPMARAVVGGLLSATLITLVLVPVVYAIFERRKLK